MPDIQEWNNGEEMTKEFALSAIKEMRQFYRRLYFFPEQKPFNSAEDFDGAVQILNGLRDFISQVAE